MIDLLFSLLRGVGKTASRRLFQTAMLFVALVLYSTTGYMYFELPRNPDLTWIDGLWWSLVTMTTVGYGDLFPTTLWGRVLVGFPTMLFGVGILGYMLSLLATAMLESKMLETRGMNEITLNDHIIVCGLGSVERLLKLVHEIRRDIATSDSEVVLVDDTLEELPPDLLALKVRFVKGNPSREGVLRKAGLLTAKAVIIQAACGDPEASDNHNLRVALLVETMYPEVFTVVECCGPENEDFFRRANCDSVVCIASLAEQMLIQELQDTGVAQVISELTSNTHGRQFYIVDLPKPPETYWELRSRYDDGTVALMGIRRGDENHILPGDDFKLDGGDRAILISSERPK
jgi:voltage-gated potassium channel